ncbi:phospholipid/cholesterol/gamma-HCH transport system substrate-binding protein [Nocardioides albertanoniae]|uniref:Phospholipid/cholesterol/gamma-HCH transport system substrate-binding protein n=1 Tax=Nocardioides albertanoniae TaxID=1175486 RepID=A0A543A758_9ACTN|nr:MCE family protein [Nocardioides albertanoniae]TQL68441.1 phospholipid/cholesterol/gamma-HCH transport system substrate-binding protein [Nocardioides albertanoniae]
MRSRIWALVAMLGLVAAASGCGVQAYDLPLPGKEVATGEGYVVTAEFRDVVDVVPRTKVMANDVPVGQVDSVQRKGWHAKVTMTIRKNIDLPADALANVRQTSLLGEKYIALIAPEGSTVASAGKLGDGAAIGLDRTNRNPEVEEVLGALSFLLAGGGVGQLKTISDELNTMMDGRTGDMRSLLGNLETTVASLNQQKGSIIKAMEQVDRLTRTLNKESKSIEDAIDSFGPALKVLRQQHADLLKMMKALDRLGVVATRVINQSGANLTSVLEDLAPTLRELADAGDSLPRGLMMAASFPFPENASGLAMGDYSNALFHMDLDLGKLVGSLTNGKSPGLLPQVFQICLSYSKGCEAIQPLAKALCDLTNLQITCSVVGKEDTAPKPGEKTPKLPDMSDLLPKSQTQSKAPGLNDLVPEITEGLTAPPGGSSTAEAPSGGLSGLLGLLGGGTK